MAIPAIPIGAKITAWAVGQWRLILEIAVAVILLIWIAGLTIQTKYLKAQRDAIEAQFGAFKDQVSRLGKEAEAKAKQREADDAKRIAVAVAGRDAALKRLSDERAGRRNVPFTGPDTGGSGKICYDRAALESALQRFTAGTQGLIDEGDTALINGRALVGAWPR